MIAILIPDSIAEDDLAKVKVGDQAAIACLYQKYFESVYQFLRRRVGDERLAEDLSSEVFIKLIKALRGKAAPHRSLRAWLYRVARNVVYDYYEQESELASERLEEWLPSNRDTDPEVQAMQTLKVEQIRDLIGRLAPAQQEVLLLRFDQSLSLQETAEHMGKNVNAIKALQFRAISILRCLLDKYHLDYSLD